MLLQQFVFGHHVKSARRCLIAGMTVVILLASGCATGSSSHLVVAGSTSRMPARHQIVVAPIDAELAELTAGGMLEPREEWTSVAAKNLTDALVAETGFRPAQAEATAAARPELAEVQALMRALTLHRFGTAMAGGAAPFPAPATEGLNYNVGPLAQHADALSANAVLFVFIRDSYATAGRKSLIALSVVGAALTGVAVIPAMGSTAMSAALVDRDGTVLWFNHARGGGDPRTTEGARSLVRTLLVGLPPAKIGS